MCLARPSGCKYHVLGATTGLGSAAPGIVVVVLVTCDNAPRPAR